MTDITLFKYFRIQEHSQIYTVMKRFLVWWKNIKFKIRGWPFQQILGACLCCRNFSYQSSWMSLPIMQKQQPEVFCNKRVFLKFRKFHRKTLVLESLLNKVTKDYNFIKKRLQHRYFLVEFVNFLRPTILKDMCEQVFLIMISELLHAENISSYSEVFC